MGYKYILPGAIVLVGVLSITLLLVAKPKPQAAPQSNIETRIKVRVSPAKEESLSIRVRTFGSVAPKHEIDLIAQVSGQIVTSKPNFVVGGFFNKSEPLIGIDKRDYQVSLLKARARRASALQSLAEEKGRSSQAKREWRDLGDENANALFLRKPQLAAAQANLDSAQADVMKAELDLERTQITVPFSGQIKEIHADLGQFVSVGDLIATVYDSSSVEVRVPLTEKQAALVELPINTPHVNQPSQNTKFATVTIKGSIAGIKNQWHGTLTRVDPFIDASTRMYNAIVEVENTANTLPLLPGLFVEAEINGKTLNNIMVLPREALYQNEKIFTLDSANKISVHRVEVVHSTDTQAWVRLNGAGLPDNTGLPNNTGLPENIVVMLEKQNITKPGSIVDPVPFVDSKEYAYERNR